MGAITGKGGIKTAGVFEDYQAKDGDKELECFRYEFRKARYWKIAV